ncbi:MAG: hypothetical protein AB1486_04720 [Planctomycetota bacterium]
MKKQRDPIVYLLLFIVVLIVLAGGGYGFLKFQLSQAGSDEGRIRRQLAEIGEVGGKIEQLLEEIDKDEARTHDSVNAYIFDKARIAGINISVSPRSDSRGEGYVDHPYDLKILRKQNEGGVRRSDILTWLYDLETRTHNLKVTDINLSQEGNVPADSWKFDGQVVHRQPAKDKM